MTYHLTKRKHGRCFLSSNAEKDELVRVACTNAATLSSVHHYLCVSSQPPDICKHCPFHPDRGDECSENNSSGPLSIFVSTLRCCCSVVAPFFVCNLNFNSANLACTILGCHLSALTGLTFGDGHWWTVGTR